MSNTGIIDRRIIPLVQERIGDALRMARDPNCQDLLMKLQMLKTARETAIMISDMKLGSRRTNYWLHHAINQAEEVAYYLHYYFEPFWQNAKAKEINLAKQIRERSLARLRKEACG